jgi:hypothetical protein
VSFDLDVSFVNGPLVGSIYDPFLLTIFYDDADITFGDANDGDGFIGPNQSLEIVYDGVNVEGLDVDFPAFPQVSFQDCIPDAINFLITSFDLPELLDFGIAELFVGGGVVYDQATGKYSTSAEVILVAPIPLPAGLPLLAGGLGLMALASRRRKRD